MDPEKNVAFSNTLKIINISPVTGSNLCFVSGLSGKMLLYRNSFGCYTRAADTVEQEFLNGTKQKLQSQADNCSRNPQYEMSDNFRPECWVVAMAGQVSRSAFTT